MKYYTLDGKSVQIQNCGGCSFHSSRFIEAGGSYEHQCSYPWLEDEMIWETAYEPAEGIHGSCPLSDNRVLHQLTVSLSCLYWSIVELYNKYKEWREK